MNKKQQEKIDARIEKGNRDPDAYRPRVVESSDAPVLSESWLLEEDTGTVTVEIQVIGGKSLALETFQVDVVRGLTLMQTIAIQEAVEAYPLDPKLTQPDYKPTPQERLELQKRYDIRRRATIAQAIVRKDDSGDVIPIFTYGGEGAGIPIEGRSESLVAGLYDAYEVVNVPGRQVEFLNRFPSVGGDDAGQATGDESASDG